MEKYKIYIDTIKNHNYEHSNFGLRDRRYYSIQGQIGTPERGIQSSKQVITLQEGQDAGTSMPLEPNYPPFSYLDNNIGRLTNNLELNSFKVTYKGVNGNGLINKLPEDLRNYMLNYDEHYEPSGYNTYPKYPKYSNIYRNMNTIKGASNFEDRGINAFGSFVEIDHINNFKDIGFNENTNTYLVSNFFHYDQKYAVYSKSINAVNLENYNMNGKNGVPMIFDNNGKIKVGFNNKQVYLIFKLKYEYPEHPSLSLKYIMCNPVGYTDPWYLTYSNEYGIIWAQFDDNDINSYLECIPIQIKFSYDRNLHNEVNISAEEVNTTYIPDDMNILPQSTKFSEENYKLVVSNNDPFYNLEFIEAEHIAGCWGNYAIINSGFEFDNNVYYPIFKGWFWGMSCELGWENYVSNGNTYYLVYVEGKGLDWVLVDSFNYENYKNDYITYIRQIYFGDDQYANINLRNDQVNISDSVYQMRLNTKDESDIYNYDNNEILGILGG